MADDVAKTEISATRVDPLSAGMRAAPTPGQHLGKYVVERTIGQGGMGIVVAAHHEAIGETVAVKVLHPRLAKDAMQAERFTREARATAKIKSEHVVRVIDAGKDEATGSPFIVMEYLVGKEVAHLLTESPLPWAFAVEVTLQVCEAVASAHALGIIHRDLKPANFFLCERPGGVPLVKVLDFGISKAFAAEGEVDPKLTETQASFGSPTYMSPEQIRSAKHVDARSDVWSLGVSMFEMLTGKLPFVADNVTGLLASIVADAPFRIETFTADVAPELEAIVHACLEKDPSRRIGSVAELAVRLRPFASAEGLITIERIERIASGQTTGPITAQSFPPPAIASVRSGIPPARGSMPAPPVALGTTDADLHAMKGGKRGLVAIALGALVGLAIAGAVIAVVLTRHPSASPPALTDGVAAPPPSASIPPAATPPPPTVVAAADTATAAPSASAPRLHLKGGVRPKASSATSAAPPPPPTADLNSRY